MKPEKTKSTNLLIELSLALFGGITIIESFRLKIENKNEAYIESIDRNSTVNITQVVPDSSNIILTIGITLVAIAVVRYFKRNKSK